MASLPLTRRGFALASLSAPLWSATAYAASLAPRVVITSVGARADGVTINTRAIQGAIDELARRGGGTVVIPAGVFMSGALFLKPRVNLHLDKGAMLKASDDVTPNFPPQRTRIEGHFEPAFNPALINASNCDGLMITGEGTLDGNGARIWDEFFAKRAAWPGPGAFANVGVPRARMAIIENCKNVLVEGVTFQNSQFWNLHLYKCQGVIVRNCNFQVPDNVRQAPSTDGIDIDSSQYVTVEGCYFSVTDDCIACKGSKGPFATEDKDSPPVEHVRVRNCTFRRGNGILTLGSEATLVHDIIVEDCKVIGDVTIAQLKLRTDTPQHYEDIHYRNIVLDTAGGSILRVAPWTQYADLRGQPPPKTIVRNVTMTNITGRYGALGSVAGNPGQSTISDILMKDFNVQLATPRLTGRDIGAVRYENVVVNGAQVTG